MYATIRVLSGDPPGAALEDAVARIDAPALLISAGRDDERNANVIYDEAAGDSVEHWNLPDATHTRAIRQERVAYERRVVGFLNEALL
jgi:esterase/lipase